jgi:hypothetical protein
MTRIVALAVFAALAAGSAAAAPAPAPDKDVRNKELEAQVAALQRASALQTDQLLVLRDHRIALQAKLDDLADDQEVARREKARADAAAKASAPNSH